MSFMFRPAARENVSLIIGVIGPSGSGKTFSAMRLAEGMSEGKRFCVIDTEAGRAKHYADRFQFDHGDFIAPFSPPRYAEAIQAADTAGYPVIVVDSFSHEHAGDGGILDWQEAELTRMAGDDYRKREAVKMASWVKPKMAHKHMVQKLLQVRAHLILCFRAEEKIEMVREKNEQGQMVTVVRPKQSLNGLSGWIPVCEKTLPYELTASFLLTPDKPGVPQPIKLQEQHRALVDMEKPLSEEVGRGLAQWAHGGPLTLHRQVLFDKIDGAADKLHLPKEERLMLWRTHCGQATRQNVDPAALQDLLTALLRKKGAEHVGAGASAEPMAGATEGPVAPAHAPGVADPDRGGEGDRAPDRDDPAGAVGGAANDALARPLPYPQTMDATALSRLRGEIATLRDKLDLSEREWEFVSAKHLRRGDGGVDSVGEAPEGPLMRLRGELGLLQNRRQSKGVRR